ncbi:VWA3A [Branchiostoma lanceolatum]|uniref:VWA3A protein n=1 Tax=Branchiostoma lanceolatum TaxID=7740 RepID=A0A8K0A7V2_BRALA|nr:VWA3A [Branchiostoma lanceolatum]
MATTLDPVKIQAWREDPKFDLKHRDQPPRLDLYDFKTTVDMKVAIPTPPKSTWELDVTPAISTQKWLTMYGLKKNKLSMGQILPAIGFKHSDDYDYSLKKPVSSRYGEGLFQRFPRKDGKTFNVTVGKDKLKQIESRLMQAITLYKRRLEWLTSESRRTFGVIQEHCVVLVLDIKTMDPAEFEICRDIIRRVVNEQIANVAKFNLIRAQEDLSVWQPDGAIPYSAESRLSALTWLEQIDRMVGRSKTSTVESVIRAMNDPNAEAVYLFYEGDLSNDTQHLLRQKLVGHRYPLHIVSFNATSEHTTRFLRDLTKLTGGRFHAFTLREGRTPIGGVPPGAGVRPEVIELFEELEEARNTLAEVQVLIQEAPDPKTQMAEAYRRGKERATVKPRPKVKSEQYMGSKEWLENYGIDARRMDFYDVISGCCFKHSDGVVELKKKPGDPHSQTDADTKNKLINAKYCDRFAHTNWKDGSVVHVHVTPEFHRHYEQRVDTVVQQVQRRIDWLREGSRELFGTVIEEQVYLLIDTSESMRDRLPFVKEKLFQLMQEQLRHKAKFNIVKFDTRAIPWRDRLADVNEQNLENAWQWVKGLTAGGTTNTLASIRLALADHNTHAIYLLTDGRPDQLPKTILAQVQLHPQVPIHTISFNCDDIEANRFLAQMSHDTNGRYHYYSTDGRDPEGPEPFESEDIQLLKQEIERAKSDLAKVAQLRDECAMLDWKNSGSKAIRNQRPDSASTSSSKSHHSRSSSGPTPPSTHRPSSAPSHRRPMTALGFSHATPSHTPRSTPRPRTANGFRSPAHAAHSHARHTPRRPKSRTSDLQKKPLFAGQTKTSLLRSMSAMSMTPRGFSSAGNTWMLPETKELFERQWVKYKESLDEAERILDKRKKKRKAIIPSHPLDMSSKKWLKKHGLVAKKLTIMDALAPTVIPHKAKYVPILDKHVVSKVFDESLPIAHASSSGKLRLVNPQAVDLVGYEERLQKAVDSYKRRLDMIVWRNLSQEERDQFDSEEAVSFLENRHAMMQALDRQGWPIPQQDVLLLEDEIARGQKYLRQSTDLRKAAEKLHQSTEEDNDDSDTASETSGVEAGDETERSRTEFEGLGSVLEGSGGVGEKSTPGSGKHRVKKVLDKLKGHKVIARKEEDGFYYPGIVVKCPNSRHAIVDYHGSGRQLTPTRFVIPMGGARACPELRVGDFVLVKTTSEEDLECWVPGIVQMTPRRREAQAKFYTILQFDKKRVTSLRKGIMKIPKSRYVFACRYIKDAQQINYEIPSVDIVQRQATPDKAEEGERRPKSGRRGKHVNNEDSGHVETSSSEMSGEEEEKGDSEKTGSSYSGTESETTETSRSTVHSRERLSDLGTSPSPHTTPHVNDEKIEEILSHQKTLEDLQRKLQEQQEQQLEQQKAIQQELQKLSEAVKNKPEPDPEPEPVDHKPPTEGDLEHIEEENDQERVREWLKKGEKDGEEKEKDGTKSSQKSEGKKEETEEEKTKDPSEAEETKVSMHMDPQGNESVLVTQGDRGLLFSRKPPEVVPEKAAVARHSLPKLGPGQEVLARWSDEGWYYRGTVKQALGDDSYYIEDSVGDMERIFREDIITDEDDANNIIQSGDPIIGLHPSYSFSYAPGVVLEVLPDLWTVVRYYDGAEAKVPREEVYKMVTEKFEKDVAYILQCEDSWVGHAVVARDDNDGAYHLGTVKERVGNGRQYIVQWADETMQVQSSSCIFGAFTKRHALALGDRVLAVADPMALVYLPGWITGTNGQKLVVKFCNGTTSAHINPRQCFWLSQEYFDIAVSFWKTKQGPK